MCTLKIAVIVDRKQFHKLTKMLNLWIVTCQLLHAFKIVENFQISSTASKCGLQVGEISLKVCIRLATSTTTIVQLIFKSLNIGAWGSEVSGTDARLAGKTLNAGRELGLIVGRVRIVADTSKIATVIFATATLKRQAEHNGGRSGEDLAEHQ